MSDLEIKDELFDLPAWALVEFCDSRTHSEQRIMLVTHDRQEAEELLTVMQKSCKSDFDWLTWRWEIVEAQRSTMTHWKHRMELERQQNENDI